MNSPRSLRVLVVAILCSTAVFFCAASSPAQTVINSVPYTISTSGKYVLGGNLNVTTTGNFFAVRINASNVILDLNGFYISGLPNRPDLNTAAIEVDNVSNVTIRNGTLANAAYGIQFNGGTNGLNYLVEKVNCTRCYFTGVLFDGPATGSVVRRCSFSQIGGAQLDNNPIAIFTYGGVRIENNAISTVTPSTTGKDGYGIFSGGTDLAIGNTIYNAAVGIYMSDQGKFLDNLTSNCTTPFSGGGTNASGNN